jgi:hypothetical protein
MNLSGDEAQQRVEADRREVDPPIQVETARWSTAGQLDLVGERTAGMVGVAYAAAKGRQRWVRATDLRQADESR